MNQAHAQSHSTDAHRHTHTHARTHTPREDILYRAVLTDSPNSSRPLTGVIHVAAHRDIILPILSVRAAHRDIFLAIHPARFLFRAVALFPVSAASERRLHSQLTASNMFSARRLCHVLLHRVHQPNQEVSSSICPKSAHAELHLLQVLVSLRAG